jgi:hypothetical protein
VRRLGWLKKGGSVAESGSEFRPAEIASVCKIGKAETIPNAVRAAQRNSLAELEGYLRAHSSHLNYAERLADGRSIGSGQVEGACKHFIGRRLKQTGARWRAERADRMAGLCALLYNDQWETYWSQAI